MLLVETIHPDLDVDQDSAPADLDRGATGANPSVPGPPHQLPANVRRDAVPVHDPQCSPRSNRDIRIRIAGFPVLRTP